MKLESALKHFSAQGMTIADTSSSTSEERITSNDIMAALGFTESKARFGMSAFLGKTGISKEDKERAISELTKYAISRAPKHVGKVAGRRMSRCMQILATIAYEEYTYSAGASVACHHCYGKGLVDAWRGIEIYAGYVGSDSEERIAPVVKRELVRKFCQTCNGKGKIYKRCRNCHGTGKAVDREATISHGAPVIKECARCGGKGFSRMPSSVAYKAVTALLPELTQSSWSRNWKPFYELLVAKCDIEESVADKAFRKVTR